MATKKKLNGGVAVAPKVKAPKAVKVSAPAERKVRVTTYVATGTGEGSKLAPQARVIVDLIHKYGANGVSKSDLVNELKDKLKTKQPVERVLAYYTVLLKKDGLLNTSKS